MTIKSAMDGDGGVATETMADRLRNVQTETWRRMEWVHDEAELAWEAYNECLLLRPSAAAGAVSEGEKEGEQDKGKGKEKENEEEPVPVEGGAADLVDRVPQLKTDWGEQQLLQAVSGVGLGGTEEGAQVDTRTKGSEKEQSVKVEEQVGRQSGRGAARKGR